MNVREEGMIARLEERKAKIIQKIEERMDKRAKKMLALKEEQVADREQWFKLTGIAEHEVTPDSVEKGDDDGKTEGS